MPTDGGAHWRVTFTRSRDRFDGSDPQGTSVQHAYRHTRWGARRLARSRPDWLPWPMTMELGPYRVAIEYTPAHLNPNTGAQYRGRYDLAFRQVVRGERDRTLWAHEQWLWETTLYRTRRLRHADACRYAWLGLELLCDRGPRTAENRWVDESGREAYRRARYG